MPPTARSPKALFLDLDDTLLDGRWLGEAIRGTCAALAASAPPLEAARLLQANGEVWSKLWPEVENLWVLGRLDSATLVRDVWQRSLAACDCRDETLVDLAAATHHRLGDAARRLFDDVLALLERARAARIPLALITNGASDSQRGKLRVLELEPWFGAVVISGEIGVAKPDSAGFRRGLRQLGVEPEDAWHVGDSLGDDVAGARAASMVAVWLNRDGRVRAPDQPVPDLEIRTLAELTLLLTE
jgi:putative hydrolase of the HAD superfamily